MFQFFSHPPDLASLKTKIWLPRFILGTLGYFRAGLSPQDSKIQAEAGWPEQDHIWANSVPRAAVVWATQEIHWNCHTLHSLLREIIMIMDNLIKASLMSMSSPKTFRQEIHQTAIAVLTPPSKYLLSQMSGIFSTGQALISETGFKVCANH